jgi:FMN reductase
MPTAVISAVAISGSPSRQSKSRGLLAHAVDGLARHAVPGVLIDLCDLPADALLGRARVPAVDAALETVAAARLVVVGTPVYRASFSGLLKVFFDLFPQDALAGKVAIAVATGAGPAHALVVDHALRPLLASVGALVVPTGIYGTDSQFGPDGPDSPLLAHVDRAVSEALEVTGHVAL